MFKRLIISYYQAVWNKRDFRLLPYLFADNCRINHVNRSPGNSVYSPGNIRVAIEQWIQMFPDISVSVLNIISDKEYVSVFCQLKGRHLGKWMDVEPSGKKIDIHLSNLYKIEGGKICEQWTLTDSFNLLLKTNVIDEHTKAPEFI